MNQIPGDLFDSLLCFQEVFAGEVGEGYGETLKTVKALAEEIRRNAQQAREYFQEKAEYQ